MKSTLQVTVSAALGAVVLVVVRQVVAHDRSFAGPADISFYFTLAKGLFAGNGLSSDYIWHFLQPWNTVVHPANDYWQPLAAAIVAFGFTIGGGASLQSALIMPGVAWALIGAVTFVAGRRLALPVPECAWATLLALSTPYLFERSLLTDTAIFAGLFGSTAILCSILAMHEPRWFPVACAAAALAYLVRPDGILLVPALATALWFGHSSTRQRLAWLAIGVVTFALCCLPMWILNTATIGTAMPVASAKTAFLTRYEDLYAFDRIPTLQTFLAAGPSVTVIPKLKTFVVEFLQFPQILGWTLVVALVVLVLAVRTRLLALPWAFRIAGVAAVTQILFYAFVATFPALPGAFARSFASIIPFIAVFVVYALTLTMHHPAARIGVVAAIVALNLVMDVSILRRRFEGWDARSREFIAAGSWLRAHTQAPPLVMTREPWEFTELTGVPSVQIPSDGLDAICHAARKFDVSVILVPVPERPELERAIADRDPRFSAMEKPSDTSLAFVRINEQCRGAGSQAGASDGAGPGPAYLP